MRADAGTARGAGSGWEPRSTAASWSSSGVAARPTERGPRPSGSGPSADPAAVGPVVFYEILDADGAQLMERRLDGHSLARRVAEPDRCRLRPDVDRRSRPGRSRSPLVPGDGDQQLEAVSIATGATDLVGPDRRRRPVEQAVWSADGLRLALTSIGTRHRPARGHRRRRDERPVRAARRSRTTRSSRASTRDGAPDPPPAAPVAAGRERRLAASCGVDPATGDDRAAGRACPTSDRRATGPRTSIRATGWPSTRTIGGQRPGHGDPALAAPRRCRRGSSRRCRRSTGSRSSRAAPAWRSAPPRRSGSSAVDGRAADLFGRAPTRSPTSTGPRPATTSR